MSFGRPAPQAGGGPAHWLLTGLGNPGSRYAQTRHNLGWMLVDVMAQRHRVRLLPGRGDYLAGRFGLDGHTVHLIKPTTWMNLSGRAIRAYMAIEQPGDARVIAAVDDVALPLGRLRFRPKGSSGGHNGLKSIEEHLRTKDYARLRMGCGPGPEGEDLADYVLERFAEDEWEAVEAMLGRAADAVESWVQEGPEATMGRFNG